jgi:uncharacterized protein (TIGR02217 family)
MADGRINKSAAYALITNTLPVYEDILIDTPFAEVQFPPKVSFGSSGGPGFRTSIFEVDSGQIGGVIEWERIRSRYNVKLDFVNDVELDAVQNHFYAMRGRGIGFRFKDWQDYTLSNQNFFVGDGVTKSFQLFKRYISGAHKFDRTIKKPVVGTLGDILIDGVAQTDGSDFVVDFTTGLVNFDVAPVRGSVGRVSLIEFDVPCRYDTDLLDIAVSEFQQFAVAGIPIIEVLL